jgi:hypothetical protein
VGVIVNIVKADVKLYQEQTTWEKSDWKPAASERKAEMEPASE